MIELKRDQLVFAFPDVHPCATLRVGCTRTLRIPDDGTDYPLPPGLSTFPLAHVDDYARRVPADWLDHGGVMLPMYQSEAMWLNFNGDYDDERGTSYPIALKIATGKICAVSGESWRPDLQREPQNYVVAPTQPWLDGYCIEKGVIRQFVAMPLGAGFTAEEQITGKAVVGGLQIQAWPMKREAYERHFPKITQHKDTAYCYVRESASANYAMGIAPGGRMRQDIYADPYALDDWDTTRTGRCFVHIANSLIWASITGQRPPAPPLTAKVYTEHGFPWFEWYDDRQLTLDAGDTLARLKSISQLGSQNGQSPLPENDSIAIHNVKALHAGLKPGQVREWTEPNPAEPN